MELKSVDIKGKKYVEVNERLKYFRANYKGYALLSEIIRPDLLEQGICVIKASILDDNRNEIASGIAYEREGSTFINKTSFIENCETSAWGRALGNLGIGIDTSVASADEVRNAINNQNKSDSKPKQASSDKVDKTTPANNDDDLFEGLRACSDLNNLKLYFDKYKGSVQNIDEFVKIKNEMKQKLYV